MQATVGRTIIIYKAQHAYSSHACITRLPDGDWLVAFAQSLERVPHMHPPGDPQFLNFITRSRDQGATWEAPRVAPGYDWHGVEVPGISALSSGEVLLNQWRFLWYPLEQAQALAARGEREIFVRAQRHWQPLRSAADWERHPYPYARAEGGAWVHVSSDGGRTWEHTAEVAIAPYQGAFSPKGALELANGDLLLALGSHDHCPLEASFCVRSRDRGRSWGAPVEVARKQGLIFSEPSAAQTASGTILVASREENHGHVHLSASRDGGATWEPPRELPVWGYPSHCVALADGRVVIVYGRRRAPFGIRAIVSADDGASWSDEIVIRADLPNGNLGYPAAIEYQPGKLFTAYYGEDRDDVTCIQGTWFEV